MALFHFTADQIKRSEGQSVVASAAYRSGEKLHSAYYGEDSDYTRKKGVICSEILLPPHVPREFSDRETLWNAVEHAEHGKKAQLAYSFEISLQNEFSLEENIALARQFLLDNFVSRGMTVDVAFHEKETEEGGTPNPHFHFLCPIRPMNPDGTWGFKQHRVYRLDEDGNRIRDQNGKFLFDAVPTTDWGDPETLEQWRKAWADVCNAKFAEKGLDIRIDHRSYERQGLDLLPTVHEGAAVRAMEKKGIRTEKGEFNRWIKATNAVIRDIRGKIAVLLDWISPGISQEGKGGKLVIDTLKLPPCLLLFSHNHFYRRIFYDRYRKHHENRTLPDLQTENRQDHLCCPCPFQRDQQGDDGGQNQASAPGGSPQNVTFF